MKYYPEIEICIKEIEMEEQEKQSEIEREKIEDFGTTLHGRVRKQLWNLFEYPATSRGAQVGENKIRLVFALCTDRFVPI